MKTELLEARNKLYESLPTGKIDAFDLIQAINIHLKRLDNIIDRLDTKCVLANVVGQSEQLPKHCPEIVDMNKGCPKRTGCRYPYCYDV